MILLLTTKGVCYERGRGSPALDDFVAWSTIEKVEYVVKRRRFNDGTTWFHFLVFDHQGPTPLRYQLSSGPKAELLKEVARICREHDVAVRF